MPADLGRFRLQIPVAVAKFLTAGLRLAEKFPEDTSSMTLGNEPLDWYFELGDKATERVVVRHMFGVVKRAVEDGERSDIRSHSNIFPECRSARLWVALAV